MNIPFLGKRLPFTLAEPGTDPTRKATPRPRRNLLRDNQWLLIGLAVFIAVGYFKFVRKPAPPQAVTAAPAATAVAPTPAPVGLFDGDGGDTGFFPTAVPETATVCTVYCYTVSFTEALCNDLVAANPGCAIEWR